ncbi:MAG: hypothetical protein KGQ28_02820, partial [Hyphomicrobiales bacterium]|nr:hypothetical protein [Hyphomicrobiales bacterium]
MFVRVYRDLLAAIGDEPAPDWRAALQACLAKAGAGERAAYLADIDRARRQRRADGRFAFSSRDDIEAILRHGGADRLVALAADRRARLRPEHFAALAAHARALAAGGDRRLVDALLSREAIRLEAAALFLEATSAQRAQILLA